MKLHDKFDQIRDEINGLDFSKPRQIVEAMSKLADACAELAVEVEAQVEALSRQNHAAGRAKDAEDVVLAGRFQLPEFSNGRSRNATALQSVRLQNSREEPQGRCSSQGGREPQQMKPGTLPGTAPAAHRDPFRANGGTRPGKTTIAAGAVGFETRGNTMSSREKLILSFLVLFALIGLASMMRGC